MSNHRGLWRGKRVDTNAWITGDLMRGTDIINCTEIAEHKGVGSRYDVIPETLGECICLTDKNGTFIFEGDICNADFYQLESDGYGVIKYDEKEAMFIIEYKSGFRMNFHSHIESVDVEVIGNIYDNPELLNNC